jgi:type VI protein secretion system component VasK
LDNASSDNLGFSAIGVGALAVLIGGYAWLEGGEWPRITETWTAILGGVGVVIALFGLWLVWPQTPANDA